MVHIEHWVQAKEWWNAELKSIGPYSLSDGVWPISEKVKLLVGPSKVLLLQMYPNFVSHMELVWHLMLIMMLLVLSIGSVQYAMDLLVMLNAVYEFVSPVSFRLDMS